MKMFRRILLLNLIFMGLAASTYAQEKRPLTITDMMTFKHIESPVISDDGLWVLHTSKPDRGDPEVMVYATDEKKRYRIDLAEQPQISNDARWVVARKVVPAEEQLKSDKMGSQSRTGMVLLNTGSGDLITFENVQNFTLSNNSKWLVYHSFKEEENNRNRDPENADNLTQEPGLKLPQKKKKTGSPMHLYNLIEGTDQTIDFVQSYSLDSNSTFLAYTRADTTGDGNGVFVHDLVSQHVGPITAMAFKDALAMDLSWNNKTNQLAFLAGVMDEKESADLVDLYLWSPGVDYAEVILRNSDLPDGWRIYHNNRLEWTKDGQRLFLGIKPETEIEVNTLEEGDTLKDLYDVESILSDREVDVWHWNDPLINPNQKKMWNRIKNRTYTGVFHIGQRTFVPLTDEYMPDIWISGNTEVVLGSSNVPYLKEMTWVGRVNDYYLVDLNTGKREKILEAHRNQVELSPDGKWIVYYKDGDWFMKDRMGITERNLTRDMGVPFYDEDHDYPEPVPGYSVGGWLDGSEAVWIYDKYDIWQFPTNGDEPVCLTQGSGRSNKYIFRVRQLDRDKTYFKSGERVFITTHHDLRKHTAVYAMEAGKEGVTRLAEDPAKYTLLGVARNADRLLFTRETYTQFPDLWVTDLRFRKPVQITDVNPQIEDFAWGEAELVEWSNMDGTPMQGVLIKPGNYEEGKQYPVLVYYYRFFSQRLYDFNEVVVNHRPSFPFYASHGYAIFLPDIRFDIGNPGYAATKCLVPGVQKLIDMGIADPDAIGLHGHSWSGYQTAFVITQTNMFACAIAGAPVSNMTSAYSGIRWQTGLARQFQYEQSQSRIGGSLWEYPERYIENSPVFFADRIHTPLLIMFGDEDGAVPWYQGIELYLAMRRLEKDCVFLQYRGEPHHLQKYPNKVDYTLKMKAYLDHYLKGKPAAEWIEKGILYNGK